VEQVSTFPITFKLSQNYPNPFNPTTTIEFSIPKQGFVDLTIYNMLGQKVETLVSETLRAGTHRTEWDAGRYPSGTYFCRIQSNGSAQTIKMLLAK
jgi:flagellar hook assembly protein FlgD